MIGFSWGRIRHWYEGTEYYIDDLGIDPDCQGKGDGKKFLGLLEEELKTMDIHRIRLYTLRGIPAYHMYLGSDYDEQQGEVFFIKTF